MSLQKYELTREKVNEIVKTLLPLMEWSHEEYMYGRIRPRVHQDIHMSWNRITKKFYELEAQLS